MIKQRAFTAINLEQYKQVNEPDELGFIDLSLPTQRQYILRMFVKEMFGEYKLPQELQWLNPMLIACTENQKAMGISQPFVYITVRNGIVDSETDDEWHVDGFSQMITHLPEQNYTWCDKVSTEYVKMAFDIPDDFDGLKHNVHNFFQNRIEENDAISTKDKTVYVFDPYVVHRRPKATKGMERCFIRISFTPIEIRDVNNTLNPLLPTNYKRDGLKDMRDKLINYDCETYYR